MNEEQTDDRALDALQKRPLTPEQEMAMQNTIMFATVGSKLYGTDTPESDTDEFGIFIPSPEYVLGLRKCESVQISTNPSSSRRKCTKDDVSVDLMCIQKYIRLASDCNPNVTEALFIPKEYLSVCDPEWKEVIDHRNLFLSKRAMKTFVGYAYGQRMKLTTKKDRLDAIREARASNPPVLRGVDGEDALAIPLVVEGPSGTRYHCFEKGIKISAVVKQLAEMEEEYGLRTRSIDLHGYDTKFAMHLIRILMEGKDLIQHGTITFPIQYVETLKEIRAGNWKIEEILKWAEELENSIANGPCILTEQPDLDALSRLQMRLIEAFWERSKGRGR